MSMLSAYRAPPYRSHLSQPSEPPCELGPVPSNATPLRYAERVGEYLRYCLAF